MLTREQREELWAPTMGTCRRCGKKFKGARCPNHGLVKERHDGLIPPRQRPDNLRYKSDRDFRA
jgi:hypothetical protein